MALADPVFRTIVVGVDGRPGGRDALRLAAQLADAGGGELVAVGVFPYQHRPALAGSPAVEAERRQTQAGLDRELSEEAATARTYVVGDTSPARALHLVSERERADLLVVGSTHRGPVGRVLVGDVAVGSVHGSPCPVAVAPRDLAVGQAAPLRRIGVGFDGGRESRQALELAAALAESTRARLELLCAVPAPGPLFAVALDEDGGMVDYRQDADALISRTLAGLDIDADGQAVSGSPVDALVELTRRVDLLVVGSRGWGPVRRILLGSTAASLVGEAACPLLVVPRAATGQPGEHDPSTVEAGSLTPS
jgi:nucleotide-binding universal stress UspA family protein